ncbi:hypothetical protein [Pseudoalteromonas sp. NBT06-2]|uniref:hypothetical protein n=1 Tax=Pseudoalteromonas sp. NBT06-2 TaxID=2025950 RepID=UPI001482E9EB|nr:hypothetical protein [Pseudoalteromonas sp. NBT06-2]
MQEKKQSNVKNNKSKKSTSEIDQALQDELDRLEEIALNELGGGNNPNIGCVRPEER